MGRSTDRIKSVFYSIFDPRITNKNNGYIVDDLDKMCYNGINKKYIGSWSNMKRYTAAHVLAMEFSTDFADIQEGRYNYGHTDKPVFVIGNDYYSAVKKGTKPPKQYDNPDRFEWVEKPSRFADSIEWTIYVSKCK